MSGRIWTLVLTESAPDAGEIVALWRELRRRRDAAVRRGALDDPAGPPPASLWSWSSPRRRFPPCCRIPRSRCRPTPAARRSILAPAAGDPRDALERGASLLRTSDPDLLAYARRKTDLRVIPLPWSRTYALVLPPGSTLALSAASDSAAFAPDSPTTWFPASRARPRPLLVAGWRLLCVRAARPGPATSMVRCCTQTAIRSPRPSRRGWWPSRTNPA